VRRWFLPPVPVHGEHVVIDLCCGVGGWTDAFLARGCTVIGYDIRADKRYQGHLIRADVRELDGRVIGAGKAGPVTKALQKAFFDVVTGKDRRHKQWLTPVPMKKGTKGKTRS